CVDFSSVIAAPTTELYSLSLHDALPILIAGGQYLPKVKLKTNRNLAEKASLYVSSEYTLKRLPFDGPWRKLDFSMAQLLPLQPRSEEHTSELQSRENLVCRPLLEQKKNT